MPTPTLDTGVAAPPPGLFDATDVPATKSRTHRVLAAIETRTPLPALLHRDGAAPVSVSVPAARDEVLAAIRRFGGLAVDVETTGYPLGHPHFALRTIQLGDDRTAVVFDAHQLRHAQAVRELLDTAPRLWAHSASADLVPLVHAGLIDTESAWERVTDTAILAALTDPAHTGGDPGLKHLATTVLGERAVSPGADRARAALFTTGGWLTDTTPTTPPSRSGWAQTDPAWTTMVRYAAADVLDTAALATTLPRPDPGLLTREHAVAAMCARITHTGLPLDAERVTMLLAQHTTAREVAAARVRAWGVSEPASTHHLSAALARAGVELPPTATGGLSVAAPVLTPLRDTPGVAGEVIRAVLDYRHHTTLLSGFLHPFQVLLAQGDGRVRPTIHTLGTRTGRMSCVRPNLQQLPRQGGIRGCLTADPGHVLISADFSGVELRVAAALSGDTHLREMLATGVDVHGLIARQVFGANASKADRYAVKRGVFGRLYGGGIPTLARQVGCDEPTATRMVATLDALTPQLTTWSKRLREQVTAGRTRYETYTGAVVHLPRATPHKAPNYVIQRTARELLLDALLRWQPTPFGHSVLLPVHDEILTTVPLTEAPAASAALLTCMTTTLRGVAIHAQADQPSVAWADAA